MLGTEPIQPLRSLARVVAMALIMSMEKSYGVCHTELFNQRRKSVGGKLSCRSSLLSCCWGH